MKSSINYAACMAILFTLSVSAQDLNDLRKVFSRDKAFSEENAVAGLKEALVQGVTKGSELVSKIDGYYKNPEIAIPMPPDAAKVESTLRRIGMGRKVDDAVEAMNRAAEDAASAAKPIFIDAIQNLTINDAVSIVKGSDTAATHYLRGATATQLHQAFRPSIQRSLDNVDATKHWAAVIGTYNKVPFVKKVNTDLADYVTGMAIEGLLHMIAKEEALIRNDPAARTTDLLKKIFK